MNNPFDYTPSDACREAFGRLVERLDALRQSADPADVAFISELDAGKMLGVLIAADGHGCRHTLYAFSGQLGAGGFNREGFVGPVFDYLQPEGDFRTRMEQISEANRAIERMECEVVFPAQRAYDTALSDGQDILESLRKEFLKHKQMRTARRAAGVDDPTELAAMTRQSQFEKAELRRQRQYLEAELEPLKQKLENAKSVLADMKRRRREVSEQLQQWLFENFRLLNANGETRSLAEIFASTPIRIPPSGAGECCAPKLLQAAYLRGWQPLSMAEYWYGLPRDGEVRSHGCHYPACRGKCLPVLRWMLQGLDVTPRLDDDADARCSFAEPKILFENRWFCVVDKPSGMLSVPGKGAALSLREWLVNYYGAGRQVRMAHRLDRDTSGLIIATFGEQAYKAMQALFATRQVDKIYTAELEGDWRRLGIAIAGRIELPLAPDWLDRPRQRVDETDGKPAVTDYQFLSSDGRSSRVEFHPLTGRTHQLRVHAAAALGMPIVGDRLYAPGSNPANRRLCLHACRISLTFPLDNRSYTFTSPSPF